MCASIKSVECHWNISSRCGTNICRICSSALMKDSGLPPTKRLFFKSYCPSMQSVCAVKTRLRRYFITSILYNILLNYLQKVAKEKVYPAAAFRSCRGILALENKYSLERLVTACHMADIANTYSYNYIVDILRNGQDLSYVSNPDNEQPSDPKAHKNLRGRDYFITSLTNKK